MSLPTRHRLWILLGLSLCLAAGAGAWLFLRGSLAERTDPEQLIIVAPVGSEVV